MQQLVFAIFNGVASGMAIFLVAAGVTLIFGILKIINFSHGAFFMLGAYLAFAMLGPSADSIAELLLISLAAGGVIGALGYVVDKLVLVRIRAFDEHYVLIATFAVLLIVDGVVKLIWGVDYYSVAPPPALAGALFIGSVVLPTYSLFIIVTGFIIFLALDQGLHRLWIGKVLRSVVSDSWIVSLLGYNVSALYTWTVVLAFFLAGMAGAILVPNQSLAPTLAENYLLLGFVCCIIGGLGNVRGAFIAALLLGSIDSISTLFFNGLPGLTVYIGMVLALLFRPEGLFIGVHAAPAPGSGVFAGTMFRRLSGTVRDFSALAPRVAEKFVGSPHGNALTAGPKFPILQALTLLACAAVLALPFWAKGGILFLAGVTVIEILFALSWNFLFTYTGVVSFGHAAFFAIGAYGVGVSLKTYDLPFLWSLLGVGLLGALTALLVGLIALKRASGIYLAIITMALAEILRMIIGSSSSLGRDDGLPGIPRPAIDLGPVEIPLSGDHALFWFICGFVILTGAVLWWLAHSRFGRILRSIQQDPERASFIGIDIATYRLKAFCISGAVAAMAGGLYAPWTQIVTPETTSLMHSVAPVLNTLLGGTVSFVGPAVGAATFAIIDFATRNFVGVSEMLVGCVLLFVVLVAPEGITGFLRGLETRLRPDPHPSRQPEEKRT